MIPELLRVEEKDYKINCKKSKHSNQSREYHCFFCEDSDPQVPKLGISGYVYMEGWKDCHDMFPILCFS